MRSVLWATRRRSRHTGDMRARQCEGLGIAPPPAHRKFGGSSAEGQAIRISVARGVMGAVSGGVGRRGDVVTEQHVDIVQCRHYFSIVFLQCA